MKTSLSLAVLMGTIILGSGCGAATQQNGTYEVTGRGDTAELMRVASDNRVQELNAETYRDCILLGTCFGIGGGMGSDYEATFRHTGIYANAGSTQQAAPANGSQAQQAGGTEDRCAREMAADALRGVRSLDKNEDVALKGAPSCKKGGPQ